MSKGDSLTVDDVLEIFKWVVFLIALSLPFIIWDKVNNVTNMWARVGILLGTEIIIPGLIVLFIKSIIANGIDWTIRIGSAIYSFVGIVGLFCEISYLADNWHWAAWPIFLIVCAISGFTWYVFTK